jgi:hypothetical protein
VTGELIAGSMSVCRTALVAESRRLRCGLTDEMVESVANKQSPKQSR